MTDLLGEAQRRLELKRRDMGITNGGRAPFQVMGGREWAKQRMAEFRVRGEAERKRETRGRRVRCVECGAESRVETNARRRLREIACDNRPLDNFGDDVGPVCRGRLRPLNWFRGSPDAV